MREVVELILSQATHLNRIPLMYLFEQVLGRLRYWRQRIERGSHGAPQFKRLAVWLSLMRGPKCYS